MKAFSLIELMVVIAIVGLLAGVAVPAYQEYIYRAKIGSQIPVMNHYVQKAIQYYATNGVFPNGSQIEMPTPTGNSYIIPNYVFSAFTNPQNNLPAPTCRHVQMGFYIGNYNGDPLVDNTALSTLVLYSVADVNGVIEVLCTTAELDVNSDLTGNSYYPGSDCTVETGGTFGAAATAYINSAC